MATEIDNRGAGTIGKKMPLLIEINSAKRGDQEWVYPEKAMELIEGISHFENIIVVGLMTMGPVTDDVEEMRPYLRLTRRLFEEIGALEIKNVEMKYLSMGMSDSYRVAIEEGSNMVRLGTIIFGERKQ